MTKCRRGSIVIQGFINYALRASSGLKYAPMNINFDFDVIAKSVPAICIVGGLALILVSALLAPGFWLDFLGGATSAAHPESLDIRSGKYFHAGIEVRADIAALGQSKDALDGDSQHIRHIAGGINLVIHVVRSLLRQHPGVCRRSEAL